MLFSQVLSLSLFSTALALPVTFSTHLSERAGVCVDTCGSTCYYQSDINAALNKGYSLYESGDTLGSGDYPHQYNDYEGFDLPVSGPWYEFPILNTFKVYSGGSPGADRVLFNGDGDYAGLITHTGASGMISISVQWIEPIEALRSVASRCYLSLTWKTAREASLVKKIT